MCSSFERSLLGGKFTKFTCPECGYSPTQAKAKADLARFNALTDEEQKEERRDHVAGGSHWHVEKFMGPLPRDFGMAYLGADQLHLIYLNMFKHLFKYILYTSHSPPPNAPSSAVTSKTLAATPMTPPMSPMIQ